MNTDKRIAFTLLHLCLSASICGADALAAPSTQPVLDWRAVRGAQITAAFGSAAATHTFQVYIPQTYDGAAPFGLVVYISPTESGDLSGLIRAAEQHALLLIGANLAAGDSRRAQALDARANMLRLFNVDPQRVYVAGLSDGGRSAADLAFKDPDDFPGALFACGLSYTRRLPVPDTNGDGRLDTATGLPDPDVLDDVKAHSRFVIYTAERDFNRRPSLVVYQTMKTDGFQYVTYLECPDRGHEFPPADYVDRAIAALDQPLVDAARKLFDEARAREKRGALGQALESYELAVARGRDQPFTAAARARRDDLRNRRDLLLTAVQDAYDHQRYPQTAAALHDLTVTFAPALGDAARALIAKLEADPRVRLAMDHAAVQAANDHREAQAAAALTAALKRFARDEVEGYEDLVSVARDFPHTPAGEQADAQARRIWADPDQRKLIEPMLARRQSDSALALARSYLQNHDIPAARVKLQLILDIYPNTPAAAQAARILRSLDN